jgi:hypothetical protein
MGELRTLSAVEAAYVAGVIDGEGTVTLVRMHRRENRRPIVSISNTERPLLEHIQDVVGAGRITNKRTSAADHTPSFAYVLSSRRAISLLAQVAPYLRTYKAQRARMLVEGYLAVTPRNGRYDAVLLAAREAFERQFFAIRVRALSRGVSEPRFSLLRGRTSRRRS